MRKSVTASVAGTVAVAAMAVPGLASAGEHLPELKITEKLQLQSVLDLGKSGSSQGDELVFVTKLIDRHGSAVGTGGGHCVLVAPRSGAGLYTCAETYRFTDGQLVVEGLADSGAKANSVAIIGGTGRYRGATGTMSWIQPDEKTFRDTFRFGG